MEQPVAAPYKTSHEHQRNHEQKVYPDERHYSDCFRLQTHGLYLSAHPCYAKVDCHQQWKNPIPMANITFMFQVWRDVRQYAQQQERGKICKGMKIAVETGESINEQLEQAKH